MPRPGGRRLTLFDLMALIFATGFGLGCYVLIDDSLLGGQRFVFAIFRLPAAPWSSVAVIERLAAAASLLVTTFGAWTVALPILASRRTRPERGRIFRGPGLVACQGALAGLAACLAAPGAALALRWVFDGALSFPAGAWYIVRLIDDAFLFCGMGVAGAWASLAIAGRWRSTADPFDRIGRGVGLLWIAGGLVFAARQLLV